MSLLNGNSKTNLNARFFKGCPLRYQQAAQHKTDVYADGFFPPPFSLLSWSLAFSEHQTWDANLVKKASHRLYFLIEGSLDSLHAQCIQSILSKGQLLIFGTQKLVCMMNSHNQYGIRLGCQWTIWTSAIFYARGKFSCVDVAGNRHENAGQNRIYANF